MTIDELNVQYGIKVAAWYVNDMKLVESCLVKFGSMRDTFVWSYIALLRGGLKPIETLPEETKKELFDKSLEWEPEVIEITVRINLCRCIWALNYILEKYLKL